MICLDLFLGFLRIGLFSFGGAYGSISLIRDVVLSHGWISDETLTYMIAVSESTPGPIMVNLATYVGSRCAGLPGAILATLAVLLPSFIIILLLTIALKNLLKNKYIDAVLRGLKPCIIGIILATGVYMMVNNCVPLVKNTSLHVQAVVIAGILITVMIIIKIKRGKKMSPLVLIAIAAGLGIVVYGVS